MANYKGVNHRKIEKVLVANRSEIAIRIIRALREMGIESIALFSDTDKHALHRLMADYSFPLTYQNCEPYLDINQIIEIAKHSGADAIHPGYGFLSENAGFARAVEDAGIIFIGPSPQTILQMGDKVAAKKLAASAGVPVIPGFLVENMATEIVQQKIEQEVGFPVLIKARSGGGGRGMRMVAAGDQLAESLSVAHREAHDAFGDGTLFIEKYINRPRHIEFQVLADTHGNVIHLFERECSIQRRHQKVIEEAPSSILTPELRREMGDCAVRLTKACGYKNAGTIEFILDGNRNYYFLEMNTRLQVEHPVTEFICGLDLVKLQIEIAKGGTLPTAQESLKIHGHAIELRICAEDPANGFLPDTGKITKLRLPAGPGVRIDAGYEEGMEIPVEYDPLFAKLICHGSSREEAVSRLLRAIVEFQLEGVKNTLQFGQFVMEDQDFKSGNFDTSYITQKLEEILNSPLEKIEGVVAAFMTAKLAEKRSIPDKQNSPLQNKWRNRLK